MLYSRSGGLSLPRRRGGLRFAGALEPPERGAGRAFGGERLGGAERTFGAGRRDGAERTFGAGRRDGAGRAPGCERFGNAGRAVGARRVGVVRTMGARRVGVVRTVGARRVGAVRTMGARRGGVVRTIGRRVGVDDPARGAASGRFLTFGGVVRTGDGLPVLTGGLRVAGRGFAVLVSPPATFASP